MKIERIRLYEYCLPLTRPLPVGSGLLTERRGILVEITGEKGASAVGEAAPLPGYSAETIETCRDGLIGWAGRASDAGIPPGVERLSGEFALWLEGYHLPPAARFAVEYATLGVVAAERGIKVSTLINPTPAATITICALVTGDADSVASDIAHRCSKGYTCFKLKVTDSDPIAAASAVHRVHRCLRHNQRLRLDVNRRYDANRAARFLTGLAGLSIDYVEEPTFEDAHLSRLIECGQSLAPPIGIAKDESLRSIEPIDLADYSQLKAVVLKPTLLGLERAMQFARAARESGQEIVISACYESAVGLVALAQCAAAMQTKGTAAGLDTLHRFGNELVRSPLAICQGEIAIGAMPEPRAVLRRELLTEVIFG